LAEAGESSSELERGAVPGDALELALPNTLDAIQDALPALERFIAAHSLSPAVSNRVQVIFEELVSNAIRHGFAPGSSQSIRARLRASDDRVEMTFEDDGSPFNPFDQAAPPPFGPLENARVGGLGIPLVRKMSASTRYERPEPTRGPFNPSNRVIVTIAR
jgi:anti-sigma regulatory factor (Ser/Thr protein kinase)